MSEALRLARSAGQLGEVPVGAVLVRNGKILATGQNRMYRDKIATSHAEILVISQACRMFQKQRLSDCDLYVTLEPCAMCAGALIHARIRRLYFGAFDPKGGAVEHGARVFDHPTCNHRPEVIGGFEAEKSLELLRKFFSERR